MIESQAYEQEVLGRVLQHGEKSLLTMSHLAPHHFHSVQHQQVFQVVLDLAAAGSAIDVLTVENMLSSRGLSDQLPYLIDLAKNTFGVDAARHESLVIGRYQARQAVTSAHQLLDGLHETQGADAEAQIRLCAQSLDEMLLVQEDDEATFAYVDMIRHGVVGYDELYQRGGEFMGLTTGIEPLDKVLYGLQKGCLYVMAGRPGMGKTAISMGIAEHAAAHHQDAGVVLVFNLEMSKDQLAMRSLAALTGVSLHELQTGRDASGDNFAKMAAAVANIDRKMLIDVRARLSIGQIRNKAKAIKNKQGLSLILIDYLQLLSEPSIKDPRQRIEFLSSACKALAKDLDVPVLLLSQLSRECEKRPDKRPVLSDLRESGAIEQDADGVIMLYRDDVYKAENVYPDHVLEMLVRKWRMGCTGSVYAKFEGEYSRVRNLDQTERQKLMVRRDVAAPVEERLL